jgi:hypothetical protein
VHLDWSLSIYQLFLSLCVPKILLSSSSCNFFLCFTCYFHHCVLYVLIHFFRAPFKFCI